MSDWRIKILALEGGTAKTGLTLADFAVNIYTIDRDDGTSAQVATDDAMDSEIGSGFYLYTLADIDLDSYEYIATVQYSGSEVLDSDVWAGDYFDALGDGDTVYTYTVTDSVSGLGVPDVTVRASSDEAGGNMVGKSVTNDDGEATFLLNSGETYYFWPRKAGYTFTSPDEEVIP